jgi:hypothetical protein
MPVLLVPASFLGSGSTAAYAQGLEAGLKAWQANAGVPQSTGAFGFELTVLTGTPSSAPRTGGRAAAVGVQPAIAPVLRLENLVLPFASIDWTT